MANVEISQPADGVTQLTLNRPEKLNALDLRPRQRAARRARRGRPRPGCRVVILTGAGRGFCAGLDLNGFGAVPGTEDLGPRPAGPGRPAVHRHARPPPARHCASRSSPRSTAPARAAGSPSRWRPTSASRPQSARFNMAFVRIGLSGCDIGVSLAAAPPDRRVPGLRAAADRPGLRRRRGRAHRPRDPVRRRRRGCWTPPSRRAERIKANSPFGVWMTKEVMWSNLETGSLQAGIDLENRTQILASMTEDSRRAHGRLPQPPADRLREPLSLCRGLRRRTHRRPAPWRWRRPAAPPELRNR